MPQQVPESLDELRTSVFDSDRRMLDLCWSHYKLNGKHIKIRDTFLEIDKPTGEEIVRRLTGNLISYLYGSDSPGDHYAITHLGSLATSEGRRLETLIVRFLDGMKVAYENDRKTRLRNSEEFKSYLDATGDALNPDELRDLWRVLALGVRLLDTSVVGPQVDGSYYINIGDGVDDILRIPHMSTYVQRELVKTFKPGESTSPAERASLLLAGMNQKPFGLDAGFLGSNSGTLRPVAEKISGLSPWPVICSCLFRQSSYEVPEIIGRAGLLVDWTLTEKADYSDKLRLAAYRPRIDATYRSLPTEDDRLRVCYIVTRELMSRGVGDELGAALREIGWGIDQRSLVPTNTDVRELFFPVRSNHEAYVKIREILQKARERIVVIDPYVDQSILTLLTTREKSVTNIRILTSKLPSDFSLEANRWQLQHADTALEVRRSNGFHDRFLVLDDTSCWHIGCSIKDVGTRAFMLSELQDLENRTALLAQSKTAWEKGNIVL